MFEEAQKLMNKQVDKQCESGGDDDCDSNKSHKSSNTSKSIP